MIALFVNVHREGQYGDLRFADFHRSVSRLMKDTVCFGRDVVEVVRRKDELSDFLFDYVTFRCDRRAREKFKSVEYVLIDGPLHCPPWSSAVEEVVTMIRLCLSEHKKMLCNGFAHFAASFLLSTKFNKPVTVCPRRLDDESLTKKYYFQLDSESGELYSREKHICSSGIINLKGRPGTAYSKSLAVNSARGANTLILESKLHLAVHDSKSGHKVTRNITFPFGFYWRGKAMVAPKSVSGAPILVLAETAESHPIVYLHEETVLSCQGLSSETLKMIANWLAAMNGGSRQGNHATLNYRELETENTLSLYRTVGHFSSMRPKTAVTVGLSVASKKDEIERRSESQRQRLLGKSRLMFSGGLKEMQIDNYVRRTPSNPVSSHRFRYTDRKKWLKQQTFT